MATKAKSSKGKGLLQKTADTLKERKRKRQIDLVNTAPPSRRKAVARKLIKKNQAKKS